MAEPESRATWEQLAKLALSIAAVAGILIVPRLESPVTRPHTAHPLDNRFVSTQDVDARLWQDPFEAIDTERRRRREFETQSLSIPGSSSAYAQRHELAPLTTELTRSDSGSAAAPVILLALVPGGPYPEDSESRRRTRYATLSGLRAAGLIPVDAEHIGYVTASPGAVQKGVPDIVAYEWLGTTGQESVEPTSGTAGSPRSAPIDRVLVVWLDERVFSTRMITKVAALLGDLTLCESSQSKWKGQKAPLFMLGPNESDSARELVKESLATDQLTPHLVPKESDVECVHGMRILSTATLPDQYIIPSIRNQSRRLTVAEVLATKGVIFERMLPTDDRLVPELAEELLARGVDLKSQNTRVAIVSEWDSLYGRRGVELLSAHLCGEDRFTRPSDLPLNRAPHAWCKGRVQLFEYQRGLDGVMAGGESKAPADRKDKGADGKASTDPSAETRAEGGSQIDYWRRLAVELDRFAGRAENGARPRLVVGVLGMDTYDKLLILQTLKPQHPSASFFAFELDARMLHKDEFAWARNLLVVAPLGLSLRPALQGSMPPFRNTYQTASFLSAQVALAYAREGPPRESIKGSAPEDGGRRFRVDWTPRVFEIGRDAAFDLSPNGATGECPDPLSCPDVTPHPSSYRIAPIGWHLAWLLVAGLGSVGVLLLSASVRRGARRLLTGARGRPWRFAGAAALVSGVVTYHAVALREALDPRPEPFSWAGGVSMWPTELVRAAVVVLGIVFSVIAARTVEAAAKETTRRFFPGARKSAAEQKSHGARRSLYDALTLNGFDAIVARYGLDSQRLWAEYLVQRRGWRRALRIAISAAIVMGISLSVVSYFGFPHLPGRGQTVGMVDRALLFGLCSPVLLWLQMHVVDVVRLCDKLTSGLASERATMWSRRVENTFFPRRKPAERVHVNGHNGREGDEAAGFFAPVGGGVAAAVAPKAAVLERDPDVRDWEPDPDVSYWLDVKFTEEWTRQINWLAYLPLTLVCLMILARTRYFEDWETPIGLMIGFAISLSLLLGSVLVLMRRASILRRGSLRHLRERLRQLQSSGASAGEIERVKIMVEEVERAEHGAFAPLSRQPILGALAVLFGGAGLTALIQYFLGIR